MAITVKEIIIELAERAEITKDKASTIINEILTDIIVRGIKSEREINLFNLSKLKLVNTKARKGINPATGKEMVIPAKQKVKFAPGSFLK